MGGFFNMENPFFRFMGRVADLMILNVVFLVCCIPVVTIGPAITALYYTTLKMVRNEESYIVKGFFHSFKQNLRQGIIINLILLAIGVLLFLDLRVVVGNFQGIAGKAMYVVIWLGIVLYALIFVYIYPLLSRFYNTIRNTFTNALLISIRHLPFTILLVILTLAPVVIVFIPQAMISSLLILLYILMGFSTIAYVKSIFLVKILDNYMPEEEPSTGGLDDVSFLENAENPAGISSANDSADRPEGIPEITDKPEE